LVILHLLTAHVDGDDAAVDVGAHEQAVKINLAWELVSSDLERRSA
jgi:hypothetical protein